MDILDYIEQRIRELTNSKRGETMEVKHFINGGLVELEALREKIKNDKDSAPSA
jgi:hypothetical protein